MIWRKEISLEEQLLIRYCDKAFNIAKNPNYDGYQHGLASTVYKFFGKKTLLRVQTNLLAVLFP